MKCFFKFSKKLFGNRIALVILKTFEKISCYMHCSKTFNNERDAISVILIHLKKNIVVTLGIMSFEITNEDTNFLCSHIKK